MLIPINLNPINFFRAEPGAQSETGFHIYLVPSPMDANIIDMWDKSESSVFSLWS